MNNSPECCQNCVYLSKSGICLYRTGSCENWRSWFSKEWRDIRTAARLLKQKRAEEDRKQGGIVP